MRRASASVGHRSLVSGGTIHRERMAEDEYKRTRRDFAVVSSDLTPQAGKELSEMANDVGSVEGYLTEIKRTPTLRDCRGESGFEYTLWIAFLGETANIPLTTCLSLGRWMRPRPAPPSGRHPRAPRRRTVGRDRNSGKPWCVRIVKF